MNTITFIIAGVLLGLVVLAKIPGLEHLVRPIIDLVFSFIKFVGENCFSWAIWLFKLLWGSHLELIQHLMLAAEDIDPSVALRESSDS